MNQDIRLQTSFKGHRKRRKLEKLLGPKYLDYLIDFFITVAIERPSGDLNGWDAEDFAIICNYSEKISKKENFSSPGEKLLSAFIEAGFVDKNDEGFLSVHNWAKHQSWVVKAPDRQAKSKHALTVKAIKKDFCRACSGHYSEQPSEQCPEDCPLRLSECCPMAPTSNAPFLNPSFTLPFLSLPLSLVPPFEKGVKNNNGNKNNYDVVLKCSECEERQIFSGINKNAYEYIKKGIMDIVILKNYPCVYCGAKGKYEYIEDVAVEV